jgi:hypothetical protein
LNRKNGTVVKESDQETREEDMKTKAFLTFMAIAAFTAAEFLSPEASARNPDDTFPGDYPEYPCGNGQTVTACTMSEDGLEWDCDAATLCNGTGSSDMSTWLEDGGGPAPLAACNSVTGTTDSDHIRIGAVYYWHSRWHYWYSLGELGYCGKLRGYEDEDGVLTTCTSAVNPLPVKPFQGSDVVGTTSSLWWCVENSTAIGPWSSLSSTWKPVALTVYGCAGDDYI